MTGLNYLGIKKAGDFQLVFTILKGVLILIVAALCFASANGILGKFLLPACRTPTGGFSGFMLALIATLWAYDGWNDLTMVAGEVRRPERSLPIALIGGLFIVGALFMATNAAIQYILPAAQIAASERPAVAALSVVAGPRGAGFVAAAMALSIFVTLNGTIMSGARIPFAAARDRLFFRQFAHINPRFQSPSTSLIVQALLSTVLLLFLSPVSAALRARRLRRVALLHAHGHHGLRLSPQPRPTSPALTASGDIPFSRLSSSSAPPASSSTATPAISKAPSSALLSSCSDFLFCYSSGESTAHPPENSRNCHPWTH